MVSQATLYQSTNIVFLFHIHSPLVLPYIQRFLFAHLCYFSIVPFVSQCRCRGKEEATGEHKADEWEAEEKKGMSLDGGTVAGGSLSGILVRLECWHSVNRMLSELRTSES